MKVLVLGRQEILRLYNMRECIEELRKAFEAYGKGKVVSPLRQNIAVSESGNILFMPSLIRGAQDSVGLKVVSVYPKLGPEFPAVSALVLLIDGKDGRVRAMLDGTDLTAIRTGAVSGLSCRYLARKDSKVLGIVGAGGQAPHQIGAVVAELGVSKVKIFSREYGRSKALAERCRRELRVESVAEDDVDSCVQGSDVVVTATTSKVPVFQGSKVGEGTHVIAIGAYTPETREVDSELVSKSSVFVDSFDAAMEEAGDILIPIKEGRITREAIWGELSDLVLGRIGGRNGRKEITFFKSVGLALEDNAVGWLLYRKAVDSGVGRWMELD